MADKVRIGIDVGGTFTHAVALASDRFALVAQAKVPTTHTAEAGVAQGIIHALQEIMDKANLRPQQIVRVAHSTTQATNALLEGDVSAVGIVAIGSGIEGKRVQSETRLEPIELAPARFLTTCHRYIELPAAGKLDDVAIAEAIEDLRRQGAGALVAATAFSVDKPEIEKQVLQVAQRLAMPATATHEVSQLYGLRARTRTAVINAAILPKMIHTAVKTEQAVRQMGITAPLVVMRSDGGAMDIEEMKKRPILTLLSGPAAGVAAALMAARIADGIFLEIGGTSTDISCIENGHPSVQMAQVGGHRIYLNTLDVRTVGVAGGSMSRFGNDKKLCSVGPRSAHIAGLKYSAFPGDEKITAQTPVEMFSPGKGEAACYLAIKDSSGAPRWTITTTCAANYIDAVPVGDYARGDSDSVAQAFALAGQFLGTSPQALAEAIMDKGAQPIIATVNDFVQEKRLPKDRVTLVGGGGGASVWVHYIGRKLGARSYLAEHAPVISAIGAAMALLQETVERTLLEPRPEDFVSIRQEAEAALIRSGAQPGAIEVRVEVDTQHGILRATAVGSQEMDVQENVAGDAELLAKAAELMQTPGERVSLAAQTAHFRVYAADTVRSRLFGLWKQATRPWRVLDQRGRVRLGASHGVVISTTADKLLATLSAAMNNYSAYGDAGKILPAAFVITDTRTVDLSGLATIEHMAAICQEEAKKLAAADKVVLAVNLENH